MALSHRNRFQIDLTAEADESFDQQLSVTPLDKPYLLRGQVVHGFGRGSKLLGCPTANLDPNAFRDVLVGVPRGIYCGWAQVDSGPVLPSVLSLGYNPTFDTKEETVECYIMHDFPEDFYGHTLTLCICGYLRPSENFSSLEELIRWIARDIRVSEAAIRTNATLQNLCNHQHFAQTVTASS